MALLLLAAGPSHADHDHHADGCYVELCSYASQRDHEIRALMREQIEELRAIREDRPATHRESYLPAPAYHPGSLLPGRCGSVGTPACGDLYRAEQGD